MEWLQISKNYLASNVNGAEFEKPGIIELVACSLCSLSISISELYLSYFSNLIKGSEKEHDSKKSRWKPVYFWIWVSQVPPHHFYHFLFVRIQLLGSAHTCKKGTEQDCEYLQVKITGSEFL